jgi:hypothetical protein
VTTDSRTWTHEDGHRVRLVRADRLDRPTIVFVELASHGILSPEDATWLLRSLIQAVLVSELATELAEYSQ